MKNKGGALRIVADPADCTSREMPISWNQQGPAGADGPPGPVGPAGPAAAESVYTVTYSETSDGICSAMVVEVWCDAGDVLLGGGCWGTADQWYFRVNSRRPGDEAWTCRPVRNAANACEPNTVTVSAICSDITP